MTTKINEVEVQNTKRIVNVTFSPSGAGLTIIGGRNGQGKTSVLDSIAWALGGNKFKPSEAGRDGEEPYIKIELDNGLVVERVGKNSSLKVTDPLGMKGNQTLLDDLIGELALDLPAFMNADSKKKAKILLGILGVEDELARLDEQEKEKFTERTAVNKAKKQADAEAKSMNFHDDAPDSPIIVTELAEQLNAAISQNVKVENLERRITQKKEAINSILEQIARLKQAVDDGEKELLELEGQRSPFGVVDTSHIQEQIKNAEAINAKVRENEKFNEQNRKAWELQKQSDSLTEEIESIRAARTALLDGAKLPLKGLSVQDGELVYNGAVWDGMSGSEQLRVGTAIVRAVNPKCGFVLLDKLEQMDAETLQEFSQWAADEGLQIIATRVSTGEECTLILEDGNLARK